MRKRGRQNDFRVRRRFVAVALGNASEYELGILEGVRERLKAWEIVVLAGGYELPLRQLALTGELAGAIGDFVSDAWVDGLRADGIAVVQTAMGSRLRNGPNVGLDFGAMGRDAAEALLRNGCQALGCVGIPGQHATTEIWTAFAAAAGSVEARLTIAGTAPLLREWLDRLSRPCGILAASDRLARMVIAAARTLDWKLPRDLAVVGAGNQRIESLLAGVPLSSFAFPAREIGRAAGEAMEQLIQSGASAVGQEVLLPARLIERESSLRSASGLARAMAMIHSRFAEPLQVDDLARAAGMSRRALEIAFREEAGVSPAACIAAVRRQEAERLLTAGVDDIGNVGAACGYPDLPQFSAVFKRWTGISPSAFRQKMGPDRGSKSLAKKIRQRTP